MKKHVPYEKLSRRAKKAIDQRDRAQWGNIRPVTRRIESAKLYNRKKLPHIGRDDAGAFLWGLKDEVFGQRKESIYSRGNERIVEFIVFGMKSRRIFA